VTLISLPEVFCGPQICQKCVGSWGSVPDSAGGGHDAPPDPLVGWVGDTPSSIPTPLGASILAPSALSFCGPQCKILAMPLPANNHNWTIWTCVI